MNRFNNAELSSSIGKSFLRAGIIVFLIVTVFFTYKSCTGYEDLTYKGTYSYSTKVSKKRKTINTRNSYGNKYYYFVRFTPREKNQEEISLRYVSRKYYNKMQILSVDSYKSFEVFTTSNGNLFPVSGTDVTNEEAERQYRVAFPPTLFYLLYMIGYTISISLLLIGIKGIRVARNYKSKVATEAMTTASNKAMMNIFGDYHPDKEENKKSRRF